MRVKRQSVRFLTFNSQLLTRYIELKTALAALVLKNAAGGAALETLLLKASCRVRYQEEFVAGEVGTEPTCAIWD